MDDWINLSALGQIAWVGLLCGAGLPAVFAFGLRSLAIPSDRNRRATDDGDRLVGGSPVGIAGAVLCFAAVLAAISWGIYLIVAGT